jgi:menaquinol-cytochrome c reductase iron-sulfur subunit
MKQEDLPPELERRSFLKKACAIILGGLAGLVPLGSGLILFLDPLRRKSEGGQAILVASLSALPEDGTPRRFPVIASHTDAWNKSPQTPIGAVYLRRMGEKKVQALNMVCPHLGCPVEFKPELQGYGCPCHDSAFALDGRINNPSSPARRGMDELEVELRNGTEIWVKFQNFQAGEAKKIPT